MEHQLNVLISAYACSPNHGSEPGVGWNWITQIAKYCKVFVITEAEFKTEIQKSVQDLPQKDNLLFYFNDIGEKVRKMCWNQGDYRFYYFYRFWQQRTFLIAKQIIESHKIDVIHQLNMIGFREPGYLWKIEGIPFIWGPVGGFNFVPFSYLSSLGFKKALFYFTKNVLNYIQVKTDRRVHSAVSKAKLILASSGDSESALKRFFNKDTILFNETGCEINNNDSSQTNQNGEFRILWVGRFIPTKLLDLALKIFNQVKHLKGVSLHIVGDGTDSQSKDYWEKYSYSLGINEQCKWYGQIPHHEVQNLMLNSELLLFTSLIEGTSHVVLESIANSLPILCFNTCGHGEIVDNEIGCKIPLETPIKSISKFAREIDYLYSNRHLLKKMSMNCRNKLEDLSWQKIGVRINTLYQYTVNDNRLNS